MAVGAFAIVAAIGHHHALKSVLVVPYVLLDQPGAEVQVVGKIYRAPGALSMFVTEDGNRRRDIAFPALPRPDANQRVRMFIDRLDDVCARSCHGRVSGVCADGASCTVINATEIIVLW
jgi:hypothetical protein